MYILQHTGQMPLSPPEYDPAHRRPNIDLGW